MSDNNSTSGRRTFLRKTAASLGIGAGIIPTVSASSESDAVHFSKTNAFDELVSERIEVSSELQGLTPHWTLLTLPYEGVTRAIKKSDAPSSVVARHTEQLKTLRSIYEIEQEHHVDRHNDQDVTTFSLKNNSVPEFGEVVNRRDFSKLRAAVAEGISRNFAEEMGLSTQWSTDTHKKITRIAAEKDYYSNVDAVAGHADDPDYNDISPPSWAVGDKRYYFRAIKSYNHYFNPSLTRRTGGAPSNMEQRLNEALNASSSSVQHEKLGRATHYIHDVCQPLHTGMEVEQGADYALNEGTGGTPIHYQYENYVSNEWNSSQFDFKGTLKGEYGQHYFNDASAFIKGQASKAHQHASTVFYTISGQLVLNWKKDLKNITNSMLIESLKGSRAAMNQFE